MAILEKLAVDKDKLIVPVLAGTLIFVMAILWGPDVVGWGPGSQAQGVGVTGELNPGGQQATGAASKSASGGPRFPGWREGEGGTPGYLEAAGANLTRWRRHAFAATEGLLGAHPVEPQGHAKFSLLDPIVTCPDFSTPRRWGEGDGGKYLCLLDRLQEPCTVLSIGGNNEYQFEELMLKHTPCRVVTLDCTVDGWSVDGGKRHEFMKTCLGSAATAASRGDFITIGTLLAKLNVKHIDILKIDIEGYEWEVFPAWEDTEEGGIPTQIAMESHFLTDINGNGLREYSLTEMMLFFQHFASLGYAIASHEDNSLCQSCSEFLLLRVE